jgi:serine/threonine protein phosphatase PrpC
MGKGPGVTQDDPAGLALAMLLRRSHLMPPQELPAAADDAARLIGAKGCRMHLVARDQLVLVPLTPGDGESLTLEGTLAGRAYRASEVFAAADGSRVWVPLLDGVERLGVLELLVDGPAAAEQIRDAAPALAALIAELVVSKGQYTDSYERARRALPMGVAAEMLWRQLPPLAFATSRFAITAQLEPWHEVGGDAFDYSIDGDLLRFAVFDGMGHGLGATLLASVALAAYRNARRSGLGLIETARVVDETLSRQFGDESFVTAVLAELDLRDGTVRTLSAAHPAPLLVRGGRAVGELQAEPGLPLGFGGRDDTVAEASLEPGDRIVMFSDGVVEARSPDGRFFGTDRLVDLLGRAESLGQPPPETLRRLIVAVLDHQQGMLQDDATVLMLEWAGDPTSLVPG